MRRSRQSLSNYQLITCDMGQLVPCSMIPVLPGDMIGHRTNIFMRLSPMAAPVMHQVDVRVHHFYVANRVLWDELNSSLPGNWEDFITGGEDGMNTDTVPTIAPARSQNDLLDYFGIKPTVAQLAINALPVVAFNRIYNEFYRDQDLQTERADTDITIPRICWGKDYATTARPFSAKGPAVTIPIGGDTPVRTNSGVSEPISVQSPNQSGNYTEMLASGAQLQNSGTLSTEARRMYVALGEATGADPIDIRRAWGLQRFMEEAARYGSRYPEKMRRLGSMYSGLMERPEFLAGGSRAVAMSEVLQTANDVGDRTFGVGDMYGHGIAAMRSNQYRRRIDEHGYIISCLSVRPRSVYQDGVHREWLKLDREDFHDPFLEDIGMQSVYNGEIDIDHSAGHKEVFGFSDRYDEYRGSPNFACGEFRDVLDYWHLARKLTDPVLNSDFVTCNPSKRIFNEQSQHSLWIMAHNQVSAFRNIGKRARTRLL